MKNLCVRNVSEPPSRPVESMRIELDAPEGAYAKIMRGAEELPFVAADIEEGTRGLRQVAQGMPQR